MKQERIFPECYIDTNLVSYIVGGHVMHKSCCNEVVKAVNQSDSFAIGIIDEDKRLARMDAGFKIYEPAQNVGVKHISMFIHDDGKRFVFTVRPAMDKFILDAAAHQRVKVEDFGYPSALKEFTRCTKKITAANDSNFRGLISAVVKYPEMQRFRNTLKYLVSNKGSIDIEVAKRFFCGTLDNSWLQQYIQHT